MNTKSLYELDEQKAGLDEKMVEIALLLEYAHYDDDEDDDENDELEKYDEMDDDEVRGDELDEIELQIVVLLDINEETEVATLVEVEVELEQDETDVIEVEKTDDADEFDLIQHYIDDMWLDEVEVLDITEFVVEVAELAIVDDDDIENIDELVWLENDE